MPTLDAWGFSDPGLVRHNNEDSWSIAPDLKLAIVADGMGGASCGEVASSMTVQIVVDRVRRSLSAVSAEQAIQDAIREANRCVL
jgi:protein phosphatase